MDSVDNKANESIARYGGPEQAQRRYGPNAMTWRKWARIGFVPAKRVGRLILFDFAELDAWLAARPTASESIPTPRRRAKGGAA